MSKITYNDMVTKEAMKELRVKTDKPRALGHLSDYIYCLRKKFFDLVDPIPPTDEEILLWASGRGRESTLLPEGMMENIGSPEYDGIFYTPDYYVDGDYREYKDTRMNVEPTKAERERGLTKPEHRIAEKQGWLMEMLGRMKALGINKGRFYVFHQTRENLALRVYDVQATQEELDANWRQIRLRKEWLDSSIKRGQAPSVSARMADWECDSCRYKELRCARELKNEYYGRLRGNQ